MSDLYLEELRKAANEVAEKQLSSMAHGLRMAFYAGIDWQIERQKEEMRNATKNSHDSSSS